MALASNASKEDSSLRNNHVFQKILSIKELGPLVLLIILSTIFYFVNPSFLSMMNISNMLAYIPELGIIALGMTLLMTASEIDLSVGSIFGCIPVLMYIIFNESGMPFGAAFTLVLILAALIGLVNGLLVTKFRIPSIIVTIGTMLIVRGTAIYSSSGFPQATWQTESWIKSMLTGTVLKKGEFIAPASLLWFIGISILLHFVLNNTRFGNWIQATGGNIKAARARGVDTDRVKIILFVISSILAGFAGVMNALRVSAAYPVSGTGYEMEIIAMVVVGGTVLWGGKGTIIGSVIGVFLLRVIRNGIIVIGIPGLAYNIFVGLVIVFMMIIHSLLTRTKRRDE